MDFDEINTFRMCSIWNSVEIFKIIINQINNEFFYINEIFSVFIQNYF